MAARKEAVMSESADIRPMRPEDWPAVEAIVRRIWNIGLDYLREQRYGIQVGGKPWDQRKVEALKAEAFSGLDDWFVTEAEGRVVGFCSAHSDSSTGIGQVGQNGVHPDVQGTGVGSRQLAFVLEELRRRGMTIAEVQTGLNDGHAAARKMYERAGFEPLFDARTYGMTL